ncbi:MAG: polymerase epsilon subunit [Anaerosolibacter sp.]|jgi:excinuclease UvrABC nuclease subunit|uniref:GIY-YIG nuclease family protein n=1 Tax=Anaerosolibacter sp. TaxID=1872527 RepID=UPI0026293746|nr:GIY-YIG nuclease family protein [Anaerosolibacter sp.]MDF2546983.1 polymerase epsilon subunit [Anaerosolibacter sp.]
MHFSYFRTEALQLEIQYLTSHYVQSLSVEKKNLMQDIPELPGVYFMKNAEEEVIYIGKSKNIRKRLQSYFIKSNQNNKKIMKMIVQVKKIDYVITGTELEALLLESKLIKEKLPIYNKQLKNYNSYGYIKITQNEIYPRLSSVQYLKDDGDIYYGPYSNYREIELIIDALCVSVGIRRCHENSNALKSCIYHEIGDCLSPCNTENCKTRYDEAVNQIKLFLDGQSKEPIRALEHKRDDYVSNLRFEKAGETQKHIDCLRKFYNYCTSYIYNIEKRNMILFLPSTSEHTIAILLILHGRIWKNYHYDINVLNESTVQAIKEVIRSGMPETYIWTTKKDVDEIIIIGRWLKENQDYPYIIPLGKNLEYADQDFTDILAMLTP